MFRLSRLYLISFVLIFACGLGAVSAQDPVTLTFWNYWDGNNGEVIQQLVDQFNAEHPDIQVENTFFGWGELLPRMQTAAAGGEAPDVAAVDMAWVPLLVSSGKVITLDSQIDAAGIDLSDFILLCSTSTSTTDSFTGFRSARTTSNCSSITTCSKLPGLTLPSRRRRGMNWQAWRRRARTLTRALSGWNCTRSRAKA